MGIASAYRMRSKLVVLAAQMRWYLGVPKTSRMRSPILAVLIAITTATTAQSPDWIWANRAGGSGTEDAYATATDADGNVFVTGYFTSTSITFGSTTLNNSGYEDIFLVKYDNAGGVLWARAGNGPGYDEGMGIATDADGNAIIVGFFTSPALTFGSTTIVNTGTYYNGFIAKYDADGNVLWAHNIGGDALEHFYAVASDADGNIYATGDFSSSTITFGSSTLTHVAYSDAMLVKYDANGSEQWAVGITGDFGDQGTGVTTDANGNAIVCGYYNSSVLDMNGGTLTNGGGRDGFLAKYDANGLLQWAQPVQGTADESLAAVAADANGNVAVTGTFSGATLTIGSTTLLNPLDDESTLIAKFSSAGDALWAVEGQGSSNYGVGIAIDGNNDVVVAGYWEGEGLSFGAITFAPGDFVMDIFVVKCSTDGDFQWATTAGSDGQDQALGIATDDAGSVLVTGWFSGTDITFGSTTLTNSPGSDDLFVAKLNGSTGIGEGPEATVLTMAPNPATDELLLHLPRTMTGGLVLVQDMQGRRVMQQRISGGQATISVSDLARGSYTVSVQADHFAISGRLIIAR